MTTVPDEWRKSSRSSQTNSCVEVHATLSRLRDSKNPAGPVLDARLIEFIAAVKAGHLDR